MPPKTPVLSIEPRFRLNWGDQFAFGPGKADLLELIERTGSIREAATQLGMSYMRAWTLVKSMDRGFAEPIVRKTRGGYARGGAELTKTGRALLSAYRELESATRPIVEKIEKRFHELMN